jgi:hypothetical protein
MGGVGLLFSGPWMHMMYSKALPSLVPANAKYQAMKKLSIDQTVGASLMVAGALFTTNMLKGKGLKVSVHDTQS